MAVDFQKLRDQLAKNTDVIGSAKALLQKLLAEVETIATTADAATQSALNDLTTQFTAQTDDLATAVAEGTASDPGGVPAAPVSPPAAPFAPKAPAPSPEPNDPLASPTTTDRSL